MASPAQTPVTPVSNANVAELQRVLAAYATATGFMAANPGPATGIVNTTTIMALLAIAPQIPKLPADIKAILPIATLLIATSDGQAKATTLITNNASDITKAILAIGVLAAAAGTLTATPGAIPVGPTVLPGMTTAPLNSIWFADMNKRVYRIAVPRGLMGIGLGASTYVEIAPSATPPATGTMVAKDTFLTQTGQWYATPWGIAVIVAGGAFALGGSTFLIARVLR